MNNLDLTPYSRKELSLVMFNTQHLYSEMMRIIDSVNFKKEHLINLLDDHGYKYTEAQWDFFTDDLLRHHDELRTQILIEQIKQAQEGL